MTVAKRFVSPALTFPDCWQRNAIAPICSRWSCSCSA